MITALSIRLGWGRDQERTWKKGNWVERDGRDALFESGYRRVDALCLLWYYSSDGYDRSCQW